MGIIHKFTGNWRNIFSWEGTRTRIYQSNDLNRVSETWMIGKKEGAQNFAFRYYQLEPGGFSHKEQHAHDHGILVFQGEGTVLLNSETIPVSKGDIIYIPPNELHQLTNTGDEPFGFLCVIPARREKGDKTVWAEEGIIFD